MIIGWGRELTEQSLPPIPAVGWVSGGGRSHSFFCGSEANEEDEEQTLRKEKEYIRGNLTLRKRRRKREEILQFRKRHSKKNKSEISETRK